MRCALSRGGVPRPCVREEGCDDAGLGNRSHAHFVAAVSVPVVALDLAALEGLSVVVVLRERELELVALRVERHLVGGPPRVEGIPVGVVV